MVFIHGGAFINGSGSILDLSPDNLLDENVIIVTFNYRLNVIGKYNDEQFALLMYKLCIHMNESVVNIGMVLGVKPPHSPKYKVLSNIYIFVYIY